MPRKYFRKYLPSHESIRQNRFIAAFGTWLHHHNLWHLHRRSVAGGVAIGMFTGLIPGPLQMISAAILCIIFRVNLPVALITTFYTNPFTIVPLYVVAYEIGKFVVGGNNADALPRHPSMGDIGWLDWIPALIDWVASMGKPLALGLVLLAVILSVSGYFAVRGAWRLHVVLNWQRRRSRRQHTKPA